MPSLRNLDTTSFKTLVDTFQDAGGDHHVRLKNDGEGLTLYTSRKLSLTGIKARLGMTGAMEQRATRRADGLSQIKEMINREYGDQIAERALAKIGKGNASTIRSSDLRSLYAAVEELKTVAQSGELNRENSLGFCADLTALPKGKEITTVLSDQICQLAHKDWPRATVTVGGQTLVNPPANQVAALLDKLTGGDHELKLLVSRYANQNTAGKFHIYALRNPSEVALRTPDGGRVMPPHVDPHYEISAHPAGGILLKISGEGSAGPTPNMDDHAKVIPLDESHSRFAMSFSLHLTKQAVTLAEPLRYDWQARLQQEP
jgi:hypothetical protein